MPGVVLLDRVLDSIESLLKISPSSSPGQNIKISNTKFLLPVLPGQTVAVELVVSGEKIDFQGVVNGATVLSGSARYNREQNE